MSKPRLIAFYLPQFYPTIENDEWWSKGFTEWTNVGNAKPLFKGHYQPRVPADLGYYDLRIPDVRLQQANMAKDAGIEGFCYWHYWFAGRQLLNRVFSEVVESGEPNYPFCLCWANHSWYQKTWDPSRPDKLLIEQTYPGIDDYIAHFNAMLESFKDKRYIRVDGRLLFGIYAPLDLPDFNCMKQIWNDLAKKNGLNGFYFFGFTFEEKSIKKILDLGYDASVLDQMKFVVKDQSLLKTIIKSIRRRIMKVPNHAVPYDKYADYVLKKTVINECQHPCVCPNFDHSPRSANRGTILFNHTPNKWKKLLKSIIKKSEGRKDNLIFIKSWNEWGEGNYLEPDLRFGKGFIKATKEALEEARSK